MTTSDGKRYFCTKPFSWFDLGANGRAGVCCPGWLSLPAGNWEENSFDEIWNSSSAKEIRRSILEGTFEYCRDKYCPHLQKKDGPVMLRSEALSDPKWKKIIESDSTEIGNPTSLNCGYDPSCNLKCPSCRDTLITRPTERIEHLESQILQKLGGLELLYVTGSGDPFASKAFWSLLTKIDGRKYPELKIYLHTNGLLFTKNRWEQLKSIHKNIVRVEVSVDAGTRTGYALNRGGDWNLLLDRLKYIGSLGMEDFILSMVVQHNNFREIPQFVRLAQQVGSNNATIARLDNWGTFSDEEYSSRAVHLEGHPAHKDFLEVLRSPESQVAPVNLHNLGEFLS